MMALHTGLVSVTFRKYSPLEVIDLVVKAGLEGIEWGGDIHVPPRNRLLAREIGKLTIDAGLAVAAYGSYYRVGQTDQVPFEAVLETALELDAPTIRVWAGTKNSADAAEEDWARIAADGKRIAELADAAGLTISYEFHDHTLTDQAVSAVRLLKMIKKLNVRSLWQTPLGLSVEECLDGLRRVLGWLGNVHVNCWNPGYTRLALREGQTDWMQYLQVIQSDSQDRYLMLEFVREDSPEAFFEDAQTLKEWLKNWQAAE